MFTLSVHSPEWLCHGLPNILDDDPTKCFVTEQAVVFQKNASNSGTELRGSFFFAIETSFRW